MKYLLTVDTYSALDTYEEGEIGSYNPINLEEIIYTSNETELKAIVAEHLKVNIELVYEDDNRVIYSYLSDEDGMNLDDRELEAWREGKFQAWRVDQTITVERITLW